MIVESIVTTVGADGRVNCAPMGVEWGEEVIVLKPCLETATYRNVVATRTAVVNLIDDARVFGGIHYRFDQAAGAEQGRRVGAYVWEHGLKPLATRRDRPPWSPQRPILNPWPY